MNGFAKIGAIAAVSAAALIGGSALAQEKAASEADALAAVEARQELLEMMGAVMNDKLGPMMRNPGSFDAAVVAESADTLAELAPQIQTTFALDTSEFDGIETEARDSIWQNHADFDDMAGDMVTAIAALQEAAADGDRGPTMRAIGGVGRACGACHDAYRDD